MAENKKSFILYCDLWQVVKELPDEKAGQLFKILLMYVNDLNPEVEDLLLKIAFQPIKLQLKRDLNKWEEFRTKQSENGKLGGRPKKAEEKPKKPKPFSEKPKKANESQKSLTVTVTDTVTDNVNDNVNDIYLNNKNHPLQNFIIQNFKNVKKLKDQLTHEEAVKLSENYSKKLLAEKIEAMENRPDLTKKYSSVYLTLNNWCKKEKDSGQKEKGIAELSQKKFEEVMQQDYEIKGFTHINI
jgi:hypothetical protein